MVLLVCNRWHVLSNRVILWFEVACPATQMQDSMYPGRRYHPTLYPQLSGAHDTSHNNTWYAISANVDMRPMIFGQPPAVTLVVTGPPAQLGAGRTWFARVVVLHTGATVARLRCTIPYYSLEHERSITHTTATVACADEPTWAKLRALSLEIVPDADSACHLSSIVPVGVPPRYPLYPYAWADQYVGAVVISDDLRAAQHAEMEYHEGRGKIALCVPGVRGDRYVLTLPFFKIITTKWEWTRCFCTCINLAPGLSTSSMTFWPSKCWATKTESPTSM